MSKTALRRPRVGEAAPDFTLPAADGGVVKMSEAEKPLALTFLRHLA